MLPTTEKRLLIPGASTDVSSGGLKCTAFLPWIGWSWCAWCYFPVVPSGFNPIFSVDDGTNPVLFTFYGSATQLTLLCGGYNTSFLAPLAKTWYFFSVSQVGTTASLYARTKGGDITVYTCPAYSNANTPNTYIASDGFGDAQPTMYIAGSKIFNYAKSTAGMLRESLQLAPLDDRGMLSYLPFRGGWDTSDQVLLGRKWINTGTLKNARIAPPVPEIINPKTFVYLSSGAVAQSTNAIWYGTDA